MATQFASRAPRTCGRVDTRLPRRPAGSCAAAVSRNVGASPGVRRMASSGGAPAPDQLIRAARAASVQASILAQSKEHKCKFPCDAGSPSRLRPACLPGGGNDCPGCGRPVFPPHADRSGRMDSALQYEVHLFGRPVPMSQLLNESEQLLPLWDTIDVDPISAVRWRSISVQSPHSRPRRRESG